MSTARKILVFWYAENERNHTVVITRNSTFTLPVTVLSWADPGILERRGRQACHLEGFNLRGGISATAFKLNEMNSFVTTKWIQIQTLISTIWAAPPDLYRNQHRLRSISNNSMRILRWIANAIEIVRRHSYGIETLQHGHGSYLIAQFLAALPLPIYHKDIDVCFIFRRELCYLWLGIFLKSRLKLPPKC